MTRYAVPSADVRRNFLDTSAKVITAVLGATAEAGLPDSHVSMTLKDDQQGFDLMRLTAEGMRWTADLLTRHKCGPSHDGESTCPVLYLAWVLQGCQAADETYAEAFGRNGVTIEDAP